MTAFWLLTGLAAALAALTIMTAARRASAGDGVARDDEGARQMAELAALNRRGLMDDAAFAAARAEAGRRLLAAEAEPVALTDPAWTRAALLGGLAAAAALALGIYVLTGSPGAPDQAYETRVDEWAANIETLDPPRLAAVAARVAEERPDDRDAQAFLGRARFEAGDAIGAATALRRALAIDPEDPITWARLGESLTAAQQGVVGADAEVAFRESLRRDPTNQGALYFLGQAAAARGETERARQLWGQLLTQLPPDDPRRAGLQAQLAELSS